MASLVKIHVSLASDNNTTSRFLAHILSLIMGDILVSSEQCFGLESLGTHITQFFLRSYLENIDIDSHNDSNLVLMSLILAFKIIIFNFKKCV